MPSKSVEGSTSCPRCSSEHNTRTDVSWIECDHCKKWYHLHCVNLLDDDVSRIVRYHCPTCTTADPKALQIQYKRVSSRKRNEINYVALNDGDVLNSFKDGSNIVHPYIKLFESWQPSDENENTKVIELSGKELTLEYAMKTKIPRPVKVAAGNQEGLGLHVPRFTLDDLVRDLEPDYAIEVMNVLTQENESMTVEEWKNYFQSKNRERILNVLSLEISHCPIGKGVKRPTYVEQIDLVDKVWPEAVRNDPKPKVSKYCLMGVENSYTDFHLDFAGTSVYYTVIKGTKQFIFFPPTEMNLKKYHKWVMKQDKGSLFHEENFLPNCGLEQGIKVELNEGDLMIIPSGWIHGVWTPKDTIVIGGNFLTCFNIDVQFKIIELEILTKVSKKFKFPNFNKLMVLTALQILSDVDENGREISGLPSESKIKYGIDIDLKNCQELLTFLKHILKNAKIMRENSIPKSLVGNNTKFLQKFEKFIELKEKELIRCEDASTDTKIPGPVTKRRKIKKEVPT